MSLQVAPKLVENLQHVQSVHTASPDTILNLPAAHCKHVPSGPGPVDPVLHVQAVEAVLSRAYLEFAGQASQLNDPGSALYVLEAHCEQVPPAGPVNPALHVPAAKAILPRGEFEFAWQASQLADPRAALSVPMAHCGQVPPSGPEDPALQIQSTSSSLATGAMEFVGQP